ncbi:MAG: DUF4390 domain-containing protein [candidate division KSB1 bacterium]|nr:DUF4390 domain-containing protein [candidate division KSB1 bacterium]MDZ7303924.1 DUF4390 domain-containing protein [candidate division KSB1 bacterium]MDZ7313085.1 DUF4390 domain-containing protein [candidate division KSB1 bacterium]
MADHGCHCCEITSSSAKTRRTAGLAIIIFALCRLLVAPSLAQDTRIVIDSLRVKENHLLVDFHADSLLTRHLLNGMQRGLTSSAQYRVQLWRKRSRWLGSTLLAERQYGIKSTYDPWEQKYLIVTAEERRFTSALDVVRRWWEQHRGVELIELKNLNPSRRYFIAIELLVEPVSKESLNEIQGWLAGEVKSDPQRDSTEATKASSREGIPDRLLNLLINLTGFGKRVISVQSKNFGITEKEEIIWGK